MISGFRLPSGQSASKGAQTSDRKILACLRTDSLSTVPPTCPALAKTSHSRKRTPLFGGVLTADCKDIQSNWQGRLALR
ncbi:hypothetical protein PoB_004366900 [Plakobranchus ocellatus]|uniref:Uncharacterized protein n=1 Tax=Plakobranchus ocellatus TaxID=259542 RepID=A0AAV4BAJ8_9GAST|nr:hypothetical protein PoB_004366900 [Plakobranchus ocellatus]